MDNTARRAAIKELRQKRTEASKLFRRGGGRDNRKAAILKIRDVDRQISTLEAEIEASKIRTCKYCGLASMPVPPYLHKHKLIRATKLEWQHAYHCPHKWKAVQRRLGKRLAESDPDSVSARHLKLMLGRCKSCGVEYFDPHRGNWDSKGICCNRCEKDARNAKLKAERLAAKPERTCEHCGEPLAATQRMGARFCSTKCRVYANRKKATERHAAK